MRTLYRENPVIDAQFGSLHLTLLIAQATPNCVKGQQYADAERRGAFYRCSHCNPPSRSTWTRIVTIMGLSQSTLYHRVQEASVALNDHTPLSDQQLDEIIQLDNPKDGNVPMQGHLIRVGVK